MSGVVYVLADGADPDVESDFAFLRKSVRASGWEWCHRSKATRFMRAADAVTACLHAEREMGRLDPFRLGYSVVVRAMPADEVKP